jgi:hypothetical protein
MSEEKQTIKIEDKDYVLDDLSDLAKQYIAQISSISNQARELQNRLQQAEVARAGFAELLKAEVKKDD